MEDKSVFPSVELLTSIEQLVLDEKLVRTDDPYAFLQMEAPEPGSKAIEIRDQNFRVLRPLIEEPFFYVPKVRAKVLNAILKTEEISKPYLYRIARQFWQRGQIPNALLPDYRNSGAKGKRRIAKDKKLGRPRVHSEGTGALIDESTEKLFRIVIDKYLLKENQVAFPFVHRQLKRLYDQYFPNTVNRRAKLSKVLGKRALKSFHPRLFNDRLFAGESWSDRRGRSCRNSAVAFCGESDRQ
ncbi:hypothetical protein [Methylomonas methanica]|uniref:hypothetical protein n=1 Tax=Methylomonas methanica TaxID=421 RepID=UPI001A9DB9E8|nr:hypothetical protein [Methylomonas methanica]